MVGNIWAACYSRSFNGALELHSARHAGADGSQSLLSGKRQKHNVQNTDLGRGNLAPHVVALAGASAGDLCTAVQQNVKKWVIVHRIFRHLKK